MWVLLFIVLLPSLALANSEMLYVRQAGACAYNGNGTAYTCAASNGAAGAYITSDNVLYASTDTVGRVDPGDTLYVCGTHTADQMEVYQDGTASLPIDIDGNCPNDTGSIAPTSNNFALYLAGSYLKVHGLDISRGDTGTVQINPNAAGNVTLTAAVELYDNRIHDGLHDTALVFGYGREVSIHDNSIYNGKGAGIYHNGKNARIARNKIYNIDTELGGDSVQLSGEMDGSVIEENWSDRSSGIDLKACWTTSSTTDAGFVILSGNTCIGNERFTLFSGMYNETNILVTGNYFYAGRNGLWCAVAAGRQCDLIGNTVINPKERAVQTGGTGTGDRVIGNTLIGSETPTAIGISLGNHVAGVQARNNTIVGFTTGIEKQGGSGSTDSHNTFHNISGNYVTNNGTPGTPGVGSRFENPSYPSSH